MAGNHVLLETIQLTQSAASVTFDNIPQTGYTDLKIVGSAQSTNSGAYLKISFNGSTSTFSNRALYGGGSASAGSFNSDPQYMWELSALTGSTFGNGETYIPNYLSSNYKSYGSQSVTEANATVAYVNMQAGLWSTGSAINTITLTPTAGNLAANSTFSLYGIADVNTTPTVAPKATGGNIVANDGTYWYHAFLTSGNFVPQTPLTCDYLVVAGGGGGGTNPGGGGGAGGLRTTVGAISGGGGSPESALNLLASTNYTVTIGAGGAAPNSNTKGGDSTFSTITSAGGGTGRNNTAPSQNGGSGGGGNYFATTPGTGTANQGFAGGLSYDYGNLSAGGGGGAGAAGSPAVAGGNSGAGGVGVQITSFATPTGTGANSGYYAGGGGGGDSAQGASAGAGGLGGGGAGTTSSTVNNGVANTGGGGGGASGTVGVGAKGGSGIVIIRYAMV
jgi:hypothetical protein